MQLVKDDKTLWASSKDSKGAKLVTETIMVSFSASELQAAIVPIYSVT